MSQQPVAVDTKRTVVAFWLFGMCSNFVFNVMLTAAQDILHKGKQVQSANETCLESTEERYCSPTSAGLVLLCTIAPGVILKFVGPLFIPLIRYSVRHYIAVFTQLTALLLVIFSDYPILGLLGTLIGSISSTFGEMTYLALTSHFTRSAIIAWASGVGASGIFGSIIYSTLTDSEIFALTPRQAMLAFLAIPCLYTCVHNFILIQPDSVKVHNKRKNTVADIDNIAIEGTNDDLTIIVEKEETITKLQALKKLSVYMIPLFILYFSEYFINQGLLELTVFDCSKSFKKTPADQYRWYQTLFQIGMFLSRTFGGAIFLRFPYRLIAILPLVQATLMSMFFVSALNPFLPHFVVPCIFVLAEGIIGGSTYVGAMQHVHKSVHPSQKEFSLLCVTTGNTLGIACAALASIPVHNWICSMPYMRWF